MSKNFSNKRRKEILKKGGGVCAMCFCDLNTNYDESQRNTKYLYVEHLIPKSLGGSSDIDNLFPSCRRCNASKGRTLVLPKILNIFKFNNDIIGHIKNEATYEIKNGAVLIDDVTLNIDTVIQNMKQSINILNNLKESL